MFDSHDTIAAIATARGGSLRGILRLSGPRSWQIASELFRPPPARLEDAMRPFSVEGELHLPGLQSPMPAALFLSCEPHSYTGQDLVEVHTLGSPPLIEHACCALVARGARQAMPGEFTMRAFLAGKLDLTAAEAVLGLIDATTERAAKAALNQLAGGVARRIGTLRDQLLDQLAELEAGLDFVEEDIEFVDRADLTARLRETVAWLKELESQMRDRTLSDRPRRVVLLGLPNAGKSSLFNALAGREAAIVSHVAGTTRDYLIGAMPLGDSTIEIIDTAGIETPADPISQQAQVRRDHVVEDADLVLWCVDPTQRGQLGAVDVPTHQARNVVVVATKSDLAAPSRASGKQAEGMRVIPVSAVTGDGLSELRAEMVGWIRQTASPAAVVPSTAARCRRAVVAALDAAERAVAAACTTASDELIAAELRFVLDELAQVVGAVYTDDILDRVFSRFCIGK
jgi:tRNA modification GTPase